MYRDDALCSVMLSQKLLSASKMIVFSIQLELEPCETYKRPVCVFSQATCGWEVPRENEEKVDCLSEAVTVTSKGCQLLLCSKMLSHTVCIQICLLFIYLMYRAISCAVIRKGNCNLSQRMLRVTFSDVWHRGDRREASDTFSSLTVTSSQQNSLKPGLPSGVLACPNWSELMWRRVSSSV